MIAFLVEMLKTRRVLRRRSSRKEACLWRGQDASCVRRGTCIRAGVGPRAGSCSQARNTESKQAGIDGER